MSSKQPRSITCDERSRQARPARLREAKRRLEEELATEVRANDAYEAYRARGRDKTGRRFGAPPKPYTPPEQPTGKISVTDPTHGR
jgi:septal ring factor EnvC (AmiA/AmiB activator)